MPRISASGSGSVICRLLVLVPRPVRATRPDTSQPTHATVAKDHDDRPQYGCDDEREG